jgi:ribosomal protein S18 acetylase RimI-like enzyme
MSPFVRAATSVDAAIIARHRVRLFQGLAAPERHDEMERFFEPTRALLAELLGEGSTLAWLAGEPEPAGSLVMHLVRRLPSPSSPEGREGYVIHAYVDPARRDAGLGAALLAAAEGEARARGLARIRLHSSDRAVEFYHRAGYRDRTNDLELPLR